MSKPVSNPRLETSTAASKRFQELAGSGDTPLYDDKNDGGSLADFFDVMQAAADDKTDFASYKLDSRSANRGMYPARR